MFDAVQAGTVVAARVGAGKNGRKIKDPEPWPRPGAKKRAKARTLADLMAQQKRRR